MRRSRRGSALGRLAPRARPGRGGFTLIEVMAASIVFLIALGGIMTSLVTSSSLVQSNRETMLAYRGAESVLESLKGSTFSEVFVRFNADAADDPPGGVSPGDAFAVRGLDPQEGDADGLVGEIEFPGTGSSLREDAVDGRFGTPRDLSGDGVVDAADHSLDYALLPVLVRVRWTGRSGEREMEFVATLTDL